MKKLIAIFLVISILFFYNTGYFKEVDSFISQIHLEANLNEGDNMTSYKGVDINITDNFQKIMIGDTKKSVIKKLSKPNRIDNSGYGFSWYVYNGYRERFFMVGIKNDKVVGLFTNNVNSCESEEIHINDDQNYITNNYNILDYLNKGNIRYKISSNNEYDIIYKNKKYITVFYDKYNKYKVWAYQIIDKSSEEVERIYPSKNKDIEKSIMYQVIDLTNSTRYKYGLQPLSYDMKATTSAKKHSDDMKSNNYFSHENLKNETPFDRMEKEGIAYKTAGENIAAGQFNAVFVHNSWMNSQGHRKNILGDYRYMGVGVVFGGKYKIYYTQNFFS